MKTTLFVLLFTSVALFAETEEQITKRYAVGGKGKIVMDVDFGSIVVRTNDTQEVVVEVVRKVKRSDKTEEEEFLRQRPVTFSQDGDTIVVESRVKGKDKYRGSTRMEGHYVVRVPAQFQARVKTAGGPVEVTDLAGDVEAHTSGGALKFAHLRGALVGKTSGGDINVSDCQAGAKINTSGGRIFVEDVIGKIDGSTSGGSITAKLSAPVANEVKLETSGGNVTLQVPATSAFDLDASTSGGVVSSALPVEGANKKKRTQLKGAVNGGGKAIVLRTNGGNVQVKSL